jgi:hypothetical protein
MDEVRKSQALIKMILERANSISSTMTDVNQRLTDLNLVRSCASPLSREIKLQYSNLS